jgi:hypothetical protein
MLTWTEIVSNINTATGLTADFINMCTGALALAVVIVVGIAVKRFVKGKRRYL